MKTFIKHLGHYHPEGLIENSHFERSVETTSDWIIQKTGIIERRYLNDYNGARPGLELSKRALKTIKKNPTFNEQKIGMIICASTHDDIHYPSAGNLISEELGIDVPVMQLKTACTSIAYALYVARSLLQTSDMEEILIITGEAFTRYVDYGDRTSCILFGDAGVALTISRNSGIFELVDVEIGGKGLEIIQATRVSETSHLTPDDLVAEEMTPRKSYKNRRTDSEKKFQQDGKKVFNFVIEEIPDKFKKFLRKNRFAIEDVNFFISHQSNLVMMNQLCERIGISNEKHIYNVDLFGNTSSAGWASVLSQNIDHIPSASLVATSAFGAGMTWSNLLFRKI